MQDDSLVFLSLMSACASVNTQVFIEHVVCFDPRVSLAMFQHVQVQAPPPARPVFGYIPLQSTCLLRHAPGGGHYRTFYYIYIFFSFRCVLTRVHVQERDRSESVYGSKNCLEQIHENLEHSCCFITGGGA